MILHANDGGSGDGLQEIVVTASAGPGFWSRLWGHAKSAGRFALDFVPVVGDGLAVYDAFDDPNAFTISAAVVGFVPVVGDFAAKGIKGWRAARKVAKTCCFVAGTLVVTALGLKPIEAIAVGDKVLSRDEVTQQTAYKPVTALVRRKEREIWDLSVATNDTSATKTVFHTTDDHPWRIAGGDWVATEDLAPGMLIATATNKTVRVESVTKTAEKKPAFNLEVADFHTYFVLVAN